MRKLTIAILAAIGLFSVAPATAQDARHTGPVIASAGAWSDVDNELPVPVNETYKVIYDALLRDENGGVNPRYDSAARFINQLVDAGVPRENVHVAIVVHGPAIFDLLTAKAYAARFPGEANPSAAAVTEMLAAGVEFYVCGQAANGMGVANEDLLPGVTMALSQPVATAILHNQGYQNIP